MSKIEWTERSDWNPIRGCTRVSPGCGGPGDHGGCYAEAMAARFSDPGQWGHGFAERTAKGGRWTGKVEIQWDRMTLPLRWRKPALIFASSTSDFFHEALDKGDVAQLFGVMIAAHHLRGHRFQVLTKRAARMRDWLNDPEFWEVANSEAEAHILAHVDPLDRRRDDARATCGEYGPHDPPPGIWLGASVEDQPRANERIRDLLAAPAAVRFLSCEPLLGFVDLEEMDGEPFLNPECWGDCNCDSFAGFDPGCRRNGGDGTLTRKIDWVICGGESGPKARPMHPDWARSLRDQCVTAGVPFFFKQWGEWFPGEIDNPSDGSGWCAYPDIDHDQSADRWEGRWIHSDDQGGHLRVGKKRAGRLLDGVMHDAMPEGA